MKKLSLPRRTASAGGTAPISETAPKRTPRPKVASAWKLFRASAAELWKYRSPYLKIIAIVAIPATLANIFVTDSLAMAYVSLATIVMNVAFLWAAVKRETTGEVPRVSQAYYQGSEAIVRFLLVTVALVGILIPAAIGLAFFGYGTSSADAIISLGEKALVGVVCLIIASPGIYFFIRYALALLATVHDGLTPMAALGRAGLITKGHFGTLLLRYLALVVIAIIVSIPASLFTFALALAGLSGPAIFIFAIGTSFTTLPIMNLYLLKLYEDLSAHYPKS